MIKHTVGGNITNKSWKIVVALLITLTASISTLSAGSDFTLGIFGNANMDDTIDEKDVAYVEGVIKGTNAATNLSDANYDGAVDEKDIDQIEQIISGKDKEITIVDSAHRIITVKKPVNRIISGYFGYDTEVMRAFKVQDKIVGASNILLEKENYFPEFSKLPDVGCGGGRTGEPDFEVILGLNPDLVIFSPSTEIDGWAEKLPGIPVVGLAYTTPDEMNEEVLKLGYCLDKKDEAMSLINDFIDMYVIDIIKTQTDGLSDEKKPNVYLERIEPYDTYGNTSYVHQGIEIAGGKNIFANVKAGQFAADPEEVIMGDPDIIIKYASEVSNQEVIGYGVEDPSKAKEIRDEILNRPELANVTAVKSKRVYVIDMTLNLGPKHPIAKAYLAKLFHPDLFKDLDPQATHQEYLTKFQGLDYDLDKHGVFVYPPLNES